VRGDAHQPAAVARDLTVRPSLEYGVAALLVLVLLATRSLTSPLLPLAVPWFAWVIVRRPWREAAATGAIAAVLLLVGELAWNGVSGRDLASLGAVAAAAIVPALWWEGQMRNVRGRLERLDAIVAEASRGERTSVVGAAAARLDDLRGVLAEAGTRAGATRVTLWSVDSTSVRPRASSDGRSRPIELDVVGDPMGWVWTEGLPVRFQPTPAWALPGTAVDALRLEHDDRRGSLVTFEFEPEEAPAAAADLAGIADRLRAEVALRDQQLALARDKRRTALLLDTLRRIPTVTEPHAFAGELISGAIELTDGTGGAVTTWLDDLGRVLAVGGEDGGPPIGREFGPLESELALAARSGAEIVRAPRESRRALPIAAPGELWIRTPRCVVALPLTTPTGTVGALAVWSSAATQLDDSALELLRTLAPYAALQLEQAVEYGRLRDSAERDPLTGLRNRRAFERALDAEAARLDRYGHPLSLLVLDADHFKGINDRFGHEAGDTVLQDIALLLESEIRDLDTAARFGGEEFVVLLPETDLAAATDVAERLRRSVEGLKKRWNGEPLSITVSVGVSACPRCVADPQGIVNSADAALYSAKSQGRNRVVAAPSIG